MLTRHWIELGILVLIIAAGITVKYFTRKRLRRINGFRGVNDGGAGRGYKVN